MRELTPEAVKQLACSLGYVTNGQASAIAEACEYYIAGKSVAEAVYEVTGECTEHNWACSVYDSTSHTCILHECTKCGETK